MSEVTRILDAIAQGDTQGAEQLLPLLYEELRRLAEQKLAHEKPGQTLQATALVHEAYLRLVASPGGESGESKQRWSSRGHFFAAAAEAMRRILVEQARRKRRLKHGGGHRQVGLEQALNIAELPSDDLVALDEALSRFEAIDPVASQVVKLRYFAGLAMPDAAKTVGLSLRTAERNWTYAKAWLHRELAQEDPADERTGRRS
jgi:RNA polymerase sigma factor (TIGR02999 family)